MKRKFLEDLGIEKDVIDRIMDENGKDIENAKGDTDRLREKAEELELRNKNLSGQVSDRPLFAIYAITPARSSR